MSQLAHSPPIIHGPETPDPLGSLVMRLPASIIYEIQKELGWSECWRIHKINSWLFRNFHPNRLPYHDKVAGMLSDERNHGNPDGEDSDVPNTKRCNNKDPQWFGCYHCFTRRGLDKFELFKHCNPSSRREYNDQEDAMTALIKPEQGCTPPSTRSSLSPPANPHYDPSLTRSSLRATAEAGKRRRSSSATSNRASTGESLSRFGQRRKKSAHVRRFCVDCGLKDGFYLPGDLIEVHKPAERNGAAWVCGCWELRWRPTTVDCPTCGAYIPLSAPQRQW